jgi:hypothetical protein
MIHKNQGLRAGRTCELDFISPAAVLVTKSGHSEIIIVNGHGYGTIMHKIIHLKALLVQILRDFIKSHFS